MIMVTVAESRSWTTGHTLARSNICHRSTNSVPDLGDSSRSGSESASSSATHFERREPALDSETQTDRVTVGGVIPLQVELSPSAWVSGTTGEPLAVEAQTALGSLLWDIEESSWELFVGQVNRLLGEFGIRAFHSKKDASRGVLRCKHGSRLYRKTTYRGIRATPSSKTNCPFRINGNHAISLC